MAQPTTPSDAEFTPELKRKEAALHELLRQTGGLAIAFSGGVDSSYLAYAAKQVLGEKCLAVTALSPSYPKVQREMAEKIVDDFEIPHRFIEAHEMENEAYRENNPDRCYHCKTELFDRIDEVMGKLDFASVAYGINRDDTGDFRPGHAAAHEHNVLAPLLDAGLGKEEIRVLSRRVGLPTAELPASACLASRLPYGTKVTSERLGQVERGEDRLRELGFRQIRLRHHGNLARIEVAPDELAKALDPTMAAAMAKAIKSLGFRWISLDLEGYRTGSLNEILNNDVRNKHTSSSNTMTDNLTNSPADSKTDSTGGTH
ncbi:MAG: hypothetical protein ACI8W3_002310 [Myxococcota bacterium]|jgi:uncharacterized protein